MYRDVSRSQQQVAEEQRLGGTDTATLQCHKIANTLAAPACPREPSATSEERTLHRVTAHAGSSPASRDVLRGRRPAVKTPNLAFKEPLLALVILFSKIKRP